MLVQWQQMWLCPLIHWWVHKLRPQPHSFDLWCVSVHVGHHIFRLCSMGKPWRNKFSPKLRMPALPEIHRLAKHVIIVYCRDKIRIPDILILCLDSQVLKWAFNGAVEWCRRVMPVIWLFQPTVAPRPVVPRSVIRKVEKETEFSDQVTTYTKPVAGRSLHEVETNGEGKMFRSTDSRKDSNASQDFSSTERMNEDIEIALAEVKLYHCYAVNAYVCS